MDVAHGLMSLGVQQGLFEHALTQVTDVDLAGQVVEITLAADRTVRVDRYPSRSPWPAAHAPSTPERPNAPARTLASPVR